MHSISTGSRHELWMLLLLCLNFRAVACYHATIFSSIQPGEGRKKVSDINQ
jgi:hypothetical protein